MKLKIERAALARALGHVQSVVERRNTIPILSNVLLRAEDGVLSLSATDMDIEIVESIAANVTRLGSTTVVAHTFYDIVRKLPDGAMIELDCTAAESGLTIRAGRSTFRLGCLPVDDFPQMAGSELPHRLSLSVDDLRSLIDRTRFAISTEETRYYLNGIYFHAAHSGQHRLRQLIHPLVTVEPAGQQPRRGHPGTGRGSEGAGAHKSTPLTHCLTRFGIIRSTLPFRPSLTQS
mgnify:CR=1 FL=1